MSIDKRWCPLCMEQLEIDDLDFYPCKCEYQVRMCCFQFKKLCFIND
ncbi:hypothetical protein COOONC_12073 [Cooperia oncophora]